MQKIVTLALAFAAVSALSLGSCAWACPGDKDCPADGECKDGAKGHKGKKHEKTSQNDSKSNSASENKDAGGPTNDQNK